MDNNKPKVAFRNEAAAEKNIRAKIEMLESILKEMTLFRESSIQLVELSETSHQSHKFPQTIRQFNLWDSAKGPTFEILSEIPVSRNSNETLRKHPQHRKRLLVVLEKLMTPAASAITRRPSAQSTLRRLHESERIRSVLEKELLVCREKIDQLREKNDDLTLAINTLRNMQKKLMNEQAKREGRKVKTLSVVKLTEAKIL